MGLAGECRVGRNLQRLARAQEAMTEGEEVMGCKKGAWRSGPLEAREDSASGGVGGELRGLCEDWTAGLGSHSVPQSWKGGRVASHRSTRASDRCAHSVCLQNNCWKRRRA